MIKKGKFYENLSFYDANSLFFLELKIYNIIMVIIIKKKASEDLFEAYRS